MSESPDTNLDAAEKEITNGHAECAGCDKNSGAGCGTNSGAGCGTNSGNGCGTNSGADCGTNSGADCGTNSGAGCGTNSDTTCSASCTADEHDADEGMDRAQFFRTAFACTAMCWGGVTLLPILMYLNPPQTEDTKSKVTSLEVCKLSELPKGTGRNFRFGSFPALVIHTDDGQLHAFKAVCTHLGCTVQFRAEKQDIYCACHGGQYDAATGKNIAGPPPKPLPVLKAEVIDDKVIVSRV